MQDVAKNNVLSALLKALRPLVRSLMRFGIGYREFAEISKSAFVDVATTDYGLRGRPTNISRVAVMTGLTRKEVKRLRDKITSGHETTMQRVIPPAEIIEKWHVDDEFVDSAGRPKVLSFDGPSPSFAELVKKYGGDIPPGAMRTELKRVGAVSEDDDGYLTVQKKYFRPFERTEQLQRALSQAIYGLATNISHNISSNPDETWVERNAFSARIRRADNTRVRRIAQDRAIEFVESVNDLFSAYETIYGEDDKSEDLTTVSVGVYYFETDEPDPAFAKT